MVHERKKISICVACYNEEHNLMNLYERIKKSIEAVQDVDFEIIFEDNDSTDGSQEILRELAAKDQTVKVILNQMNYGVSLSVQNLMRKFSGDAYFGIPGDLQDPPEMIPEMVRYWLEGFQIVWGERTKSEEPLIRRVCKKIYYSIISFCSSESQLKQVNGFGIMDRQVVQTILPRMEQDSHISVRHLVISYGFKMKLIPYIHQKRKYGKSSYSIGGYLDFAISSLVNTSSMPLRTVTIVGFFSSIVSFVVGVVYFILKILHWSRYPAGVSPTIVFFSIMCSLQLFFLGLIGEYLIVLMRRVTISDKVIEKELINF